MKKRFGFTLAEVLITMGVIGVVSMMALPNLKLAYSKKLIVSQLERTYGSLVSVIEMSEYENGKIKRWDITQNSEQFFRRYIKSYLKYALEQSTEALNQDEYKKYLNGDLMTDPNIYTNEYSYHITMMDGSMVSFLTIPIEKSVLVAIDTNGEVKPNTLGKDIFLFYFTKQDGLRPYGNEISRENIINRDCNFEGEGKYCASLIIKDGWKISKDYPWGKVERH